MRKWASINADLGKSAYLYVFNHVPTLPEYGQALGAFHGSEIAHIFGNRSLSGDDSAAESEATA